MNGLTSGTLANIVRGQLMLGTMPPLGGEWEPVGRIVFQCDQVLRGDVFWELCAADGRTPVHGAAEEAFARGAAGVLVSRRNVEPWAGGFSILIRDCQEAFERLAHWVIVRSRCRRLFILQSPDEQIGSLLQLVVERSGRPVESCTNCSDVAKHTIGGGLNPGWRVIAVSSETDEHLARISDLCAPCVAVITSAAAGRMDLPALLEALPARGIALIADDADHIAAAKSLSDNIICAGRVNELTLALLVANQLGIDGERVTSTYERLIEQRAHKDPMEDAHHTTTNETCRVPPSVSGLRESDAALPPGLKRWAC